MGAPKGKPHRKFTQEEKLAYTSKAYDTPLFYIVWFCFRKKYKQNAAVFQHQNGILLQIVSNWGKKTASCGKKYLPQEAISLNSSKCVSG